MFTNPYVIVITLDLVRPLTRFNSRHITPPVHLSDGGKRRGQRHAPRAALCRVGISRGEKKTEIDLYYI